MTTATVTELPRHLEPVTSDPFIEGLATAPREGPGAPPRRLAR